MRKPWYKISGGVAALCLLCCAGPFTALFVGGGAVASYSLLPAMATEAKYLAIAGLIAMVIAGYFIWRRRAKGAACECPKP